MISSMTLSLVNVKLAWPSKHLLDTYRMGIGKLWTLDQWIPGLLDWEIVIALHRLDACALCIRMTEWEMEADNVHCNILKFRLRLN